MELDKFDTARDIQDLLAIRQDVERLELLQGGADSVTPKLDLLDLGDAYQVILDVPGVAQENLEVALQGRNLVIAGIRDPLPTDGEAVLSERPRGPFQRNLDLPGEVDEAASHAHLKEGLLILTLPKA